MEGGGREDEGLEKAKKAQMDSAVKQLPEQSMTFMFAHLGNLASPVCKLYVYELCGALSVHYVKFSTCITKRLIILFVFCCRSSIKNAG